MRTIRLLVVVLAIALFLPFAVVLRSHADDSEGVRVCATWASYATDIANARDRGVPLDKLIELANKSVEDGSVPLQSYPLFIKIVTQIYSNPKLTPTAAADLVRNDCYEAFGITKI